MANYIFNLIKPFSIEPVLTEQYQKNEHLKSTIYEN